MKKKQFKAQSKTIGTVRVGLTQEQGKFRVRVRSGNETLFGEFCDDHLSAKALFDAKVIEFANLCRPPTPQQLAERARKAAVLDALETKVGKLGCGLSFAVETFCWQVGEIGLENVRLITHVYGPRLAALRPSTVAAAIANYEPWLAKFGQVTKSHLQNRKGCLKRFAEHFGKRVIHLISAREIHDWMTACNLQNGTWNSYLYSIRDLFRHAKDFMKALPQTLPTEAHLVPSKKVKNEIGPIYSLEEFEKLLTSIPDRDLLLGCVLVAMLHVRESEAAKLEGEDFSFVDGVPQEICIPNYKAKLKKGEWGPRRIPIREELRPLLKELVPQKGPIFHKNNSVFRRLTQLQKAIGNWARNILRRTCCSYAVASGLDRKLVADWSGHTVQVQEKHYLRAAAHSDGVKFRAMVLDPTRFAKLPSFAKSPLEDIAAAEKRKKQAARDEAKRKSAADAEAAKAKKKTDKLALKAKAKAAAHALAHAGQFELFSDSATVKQAA